MKASSNKNTLMKRLIKMIHYHWDQMKWNSVEGWRMNDTRELKIL